MSHIRFVCPTCRAPLKLGPELLGREVRCSRCRQISTVPAALDAEPVEDTPGVTDLPPPPRPVSDDRERPTPSRRDATWPRRIQKPRWPRRSRALTIACAALTALMLLTYGVCYGLVIGGVVGQSGATGPVAELDLPPRDQAEEQLAAQERERLRAVADDGEARVATGLAEEYGSDGMEIAWLWECELVSGLNFSRDGRFLAGTESGGNKVHLWDLGEAESQELEGHTAPANDAAFSPDGKLLASGGADTTVRLWDVRTGAQVRTIPARRQVTCVAFSPDGSLLAIGGDSTALPGTLTLWDPATGQSLGRIPATRRAVTAMAFRPDGKVLAEGTVAGTVRLWDPVSGKLYRRGFRDKRVSELAFSPDGRTLAVAGGKGGEPELFLCDLETGAERRLRAHRETVYGLAFSPDGKLLASGSEHEVLIWDLATHTVRRRLEANGIRLAFSPGGGLLVSADLRVWRVSDLLDDELFRAFEAVSKVGTVSREGETFHVTLKAESGDEAFEVLKKLPRIGAVSASGVRGPGLAHLKDLPQLRSLWLDGADIGDDGMAHLAPLTQLQVLSLSRAPRVTDAGVAHLAGLTELTSLSLDGSRMTAAGAAHLAGLKKLTWLHLSGSKIGDEGLAHLAGLPQLMDLDLSDAGVTDEGLKHLAGQQHVTRLVLHGNGGVKGAGVGHLAGMKKLSALDLSDTALTDNGLLSLKGMNVHWLNVRGTRLSDAGLAGLAGLEQLTSVTLPETITDAGLAHLGKLPTLRDLDWGEAKGITGDGLAHLEPLKLRDLNLTKTGVRDEALALLKAWDGLERVFLPPHTGDAGAEQLAKLDGVTTLGLEGTRVTDAGMAKLARMPRLESVVISKTQVGDAGLMALRNAVALKYVYAGGSRVTAGGMARLQSARPDVQVVLE